MNHANRLAVAGIILAVLAALPMSGCSGAATREIEAERASLHSEPVTLHAKGLADASIDAAGAVDIGQGHVALTDSQRALARDYRSAVIELVDFTLANTAKLTKHAMRRVLLGMLVGRADEAGEKIGKQAEAMVHAPQFCHLLADLRQRQDRMVQSVPMLQPYARIARQDVDNCMAGRPYTLAI